MTTPLIQFKDVRKSFKDNPVLRGINLDILEGKITAIIGKSGEGKSVLLKHVIGLIACDSGEILFHGEPLSRMKKSERRALKKRFSYVFQETALFDSMTVYDNIALPLKEHRIVPRSAIRKRVRDIMHQLDLSDTERSYPSQLSGGMKKRVALGRALVTEPEIILFDEPTTGLDPIRKNAVHSMIMNYQREFSFTAVVVSHEIPDVFYIAEQVIMLDEGQVVFSGTSEEIRQSTLPVVHNFIRGMESRQDDLTGLAPQTQGERRYMEEMARMRRHQYGFTIILLTIENLYEIKKMAGYEAEQSAFRLFAADVRRHLRVTDICSRLGLNKIMLILPQTDEKGAAIVCGKMAENLNECSRLQIQAYPGFCFSVSAGVAEAQPDMPIEQLVAIAESRKNMFYEFKVC